MEEKLKYVHCFLLEQFREMATGGALHSQGGRVSWVGPAKACPSGDPPSPAVLALPCVVTLLSLSVAREHSFLQTL